MKIRAVRLADINEILLHRREMFHDMGYNDAAALDRCAETSRAFIRDCLKNGSYVGWFAVTPSDQVAAGVGLLLMRWVTGQRAPEQTRRAYLLNVYTAPAFRKRGLARALTQKAIDWCKAEGYSTLWLHASELGRPLYESLGFERTNEMRLKL